MNQPVAVLLISMTFFLSACSNAPSCTEGQTIACACLGGKLGIQACRSNGTYGSCLCDVAADGGVAADRGVAADSRARDRDASPGQDATAAGDSAPQTKDLVTRADAVAQRDHTASRAPVFLSFGTNTKELTAGQTLVFSAVLTDPDGIDDLIGGKLQDETGTIDYGAFVTSGQEGSYALKVSWDEINQTRKISFETAQTRSFRAVFFDVKGNSVATTVDIRFHCDKVQGLSGACDGACLSLTSDYNCGTCGHRCPYAYHCDHGQRCYASGYLKLNLDGKIDDTRGSSCTQFCANKESGTCFEAEAILLSAPSSYDRPLPCSATSTSLIFVQGATMISAACVCRDGTDSSLFFGVSCADNCQGNGGCAYTKVKGWPPSANDWARTIDSCTATTYKPPPKTMDINAVPKMVLCRCSN